MDDQDPNYYNAFSLLSLTKIPQDVWLHYSPLNQTELCKDWNRRHRSCKLLLKQKTQLKTFSQKKLDIKI